MIVDMHGHLGKINLAPFWAAEVERLETIMTEAKIDLLCVSSAKSIMYDAQEGNADLTAALKTSKRLRGYVTINPLFPESMNDLALLQDKHFIGVKIHPDYHGYDIASAAARSFLDEAAERTPLMLCHVSCMPGAGFAAAAKVASFAACHPKTNFILAHMAGVFQNPLYPYFPNLEGLERVAALGLKNVFVDTAHYLMYVYPGVMEKMVAIIGADSIVFGTDCPLQGPMQMRFAIETINALNIPRSDKDKILSGNAQHLFNIG